MSVDDTNGANQVSLLHFFFANDRIATVLISAFVIITQMYNVTLDMKIDYPAFIWTHNGWIQQMYATYDEHRWDNNPLVVHVVPFSHHDPGMCKSSNSV